MTKGFIPTASVYTLCAVLFAHVAWADAAPEGAKWERAIQDALVLAKPTPEGAGSKPEQPPLLVGADTREKRLAIYRRATALFSSKPPEPLLQQPNMLNEQRRAARSALIYGGAEAIPALIEACNQPNAQLRWSAIDLLKDHGRAALETVSDLALNDPDGGVRASAISALRTIEAPESVQTLIKALEDPDQNVVIRSAQALGNFRDKDALQPLAKQLRKDKQPAWYSICDAMMQIDASYSRPIVVPYAQAARPRNHNEESNRQNLLKRAMKSRYGGGLPIGVPIELEDTRALAAGAHTLAGESYGEDEINQLIAHLNHEHYKIAHACIDALVRLKAEQAIPHLIQALQQAPKNAYNASRQVHALVAFGDEKAIRGLIAIYRDSFNPESKNRTVRHSVIRSLKKLGPPSTPLLMCMLDDEIFYKSNVEVRGKTYVTRGHSALQQLAEVLDCGKSIDLAASIHEPTIVDPRAQVLSMQTWWSANRDAYLAGDPSPPPPEVTSYTSHGPLWRR